MKPIVAIYFALVALCVVFSFAEATICARDRRSGGPQNFANIAAMNAENARGGQYDWVHNGAC